jgi:hypothetical protein
MGGTSTQQQSQSSTTAPWQAAQPALTGILGQLGTNLNNTGVTGAENGALGTLEQNGANATSQYAPAVQNYATGLLNGGGALNQAGAVNQNYQDYYKATNPLASNTNYNPLDTPGFKDALTTQISYENVNPSKHMDIESNGSKLGLRWGGVKSEIGAGSMR